ncbi:MAG: hypothetical protein ACK4RK_03775 [Gemmataceae bacterium]
MRPLHHPYLRPRQPVQLIHQLIHPLIGGGDPALQARSLGAGLRGCQLLVKGPQVIDEGDEAGEQRIIME